MAGSLTKVLVIPCVALLAGVLLLLTGTVSFGDPVDSSPTPVITPFELKSDPTQPETGTPVPPPPAAGNKGGCDNDGSKPLSTIPVTNSPPQNVRIVSIEYLPAFQRAIIRLDWDEDPSATCRVFEVVANDDSALPEGEPVLWLGLPGTPQFRVPASYCFRLYSGTATGRSEFSNSACTDLEVPPPEICDIDPSRGEFTTCELLP